MDMEDGQVKEDVEGDVGERIGQAELPSWD